MMRSLLCVLAAWLVLGQMNGPFLSPVYSVTTPIYIEDSPDAEDLAKKAKLLRDQGRLTEAAAAYQKIAQQFTFKLMKREGEVYVDAVRWVRNAVVGDEKLLSAYRNLYGDAADRELAQAMQPTPDIRALEAVTSEYILCEAGLDATLKLAALFLERANPLAAGNVLDEAYGHPDLAAHHSTWHLLQAAAGLYSRDVARLESHSKSLAGLNDTKSLQKLREWQAAMAVRSEEHIVKELRTPYKVDLPQPLGKPLYSIDAMKIEGVARPSNVNRRPAFIPKDQQVIPTADSDVLYVNTGTVLRALDRSSLSDVWSSPFRLPDTDGGTIRPVVSNNKNVRDRYGVLIDGDVLIAVMGHGSLVRGQWSTTTPNTEIVGVNRVDGRLLWRRRPDQIDKTLSTAFIHGIPIGGHGQAYVMLRREQNSGFSDAYIAAIDTQTGKTKWRRHVSSCSLQYTQRSLAQPLVDRGRVYVSDNLGAVACIDGRTGAMLWLHRMNNPVAAAVPSTHIANGNAWQIGAPIRVEAGLIVPPLEPNKAAVLLDPQTGRKLGDLKDQAWTQAKYLTAAGKDVISIDRYVHCFDGRTLKIRWKKDLGRLVEPSARAAITANQLVIPTDNKLITLNLETGDIQSRSDVETSGNVLALDGQILIADGSVLRSYMTWPVVYKNLLSRIRRNPTDPQPGLALAHAALSSNRSDEVLEGLDHVVSVLRRRASERPLNLRPEADDVHADAFQQLLKLVEPGNTTDLELRGRMFERVARATSTPADEVQYHLALGAYYGESDWPKAQLEERLASAVRHYQTILESPSLSLQLFPRGTGWQRAGLEARQRLATLIKRHSQKIYAEFDLRASDRLDRLTNTPSVKPESLVELARQYPLSNAAPEALLAAGELLAKLDRTQDAITQLRRAYRESSPDKVQQRVLGQLVQQYLKVGKPRRAQQWLLRARRDNIQPVRDGKPADVKQWLAELGELPSADSTLPQIGLKIGKTIKLPGRLLMSSLQPDELQPHDRFVTFLDKEASLRVAPRFTPLWNVKFDGATRLLWLNEQVALFWESDNGRLVGVNAKTGKRLWKDLSAATLLHEIGENNLRRAAKPRPAGDGIGLALLEEAEPRPAANADANAAANNDANVFARDDALPQRAAIDVFIEVNDGVVVLADKRGRVVGIDVDTGQIMWRFLCPFERLDFIRMKGESIALAGVNQPDTEEEAPIVAALDALTGDMLCQLEAPGRVAWLGLTEEGALLYAVQPELRRGAARISIHRLPDGELAWRKNIMVDTDAIASIYEAGDSLIVRSQRGHVIIVDTLNRQVRDPIAGINLDARDIFDVRAASGQWHLLTEARAFSVNDEGKRVWQDGLDETAGPRQVQLVGRDHLVIVTMPEPTDPDQLLQRRLFELRRPPRAPGETPPTIDHTLFILDRKGGLLEKAIDLPAPGSTRPDRALLMKGHIVISTEVQTLVIPATLQSN